jgi:hypothetical protein
MSDHPTGLEDKDKMKPKQSRLGGIAPWVSINLGQLPLRLACQPGAFIRAAT